MSKTNPTEFQIGRHMMSMWVPQALHAAAELGIADLLAEGPLPSSGVAARLGTHPDATARLLRALEVLEIVELQGEGFALSALGQFLRSDLPTSRRAWARLMGGAPVWRAWGKLTDCVRTGQPAYARGEERRSETETFDLLSEDFEAAAVFHRAMADGTRGIAPAVLGALEVRGDERVVDVGGGWGELLCAFLENHPRMRGAVYDLEHAREGAEATFARRGLSERARFVGGDLFEDPPPPADLYLLKSVVHDWDDDRSLSILGRIRSAMKPEDRLVVIEPPAPEPGAEVPPSMKWVIAFSDLNMLVNTGGKERTAAQYRALLERADLRLDGIREAGFYACFVCRRAP